MLHAEITEKILEACFEVINDLGAGFLESVYEKALVVALRQKGLKVESQVELEVKFRGVIVGNFCADIIVEDKVVVEVKAVKSLLPEHMAQVINYLKAARIDIGLLVNFGRQRLEYKRLYKESDTEAKPAEGVK